MWRATLMALGMCLVILGLECMVVDRAILADDATDARARVNTELSSPYTSSFTPYTP